jgi:hypothetical protein
MCRVSDFRRSRRCSLVRTRQIRRICGKRGSFPPRSRAKVAPLLHDTLAAGIDDPDATRTALEQAASGTCGLEEGRV